MGTTARLFLWHPPAGLETDLRDRLTDLESRWSRFLATSDTTAINAAPGQPVVVGSDTVMLVELALTASRLTHGWFDPTLLLELAEHGYDRTYAELSTGCLGDLIITPDRSVCGESVQVHDWTARSRDIIVNQAESTITVPAGTGFDPGGIGKGLTADMLATHAGKAGAVSAMVDLGGDIATSGIAPDGGWFIDVEDPFDRDNTACSLRLPWGAVATSSRSKRRWLHEGEEHHHLFDPRTRAPSTSNVASATVIAGECWLAEAYAKAAVVAGTRVGLELLTRAGVEGLVIDHNQHHHLTPGMSGFFA